MGRHPVKPLPLSKQELRRVFFLEETRKVDKTACVSLDGLSYKVPAELCGLKVELRYDPFDPSDVEVHLDGSLVGKAVISDPVANFKKRFRKGSAQQEEADTLLAGQLVFSVSGQTNEWTPPSGEEPVETEVAQ